MNYKSYLKLDHLLALQEPRSDPPEHDETLFIIIHQVYELWFKLLLHEFGRINTDLGANDLFRAVAGFKRARTVMKTLVSQLDILETMTPMSFTAFREHLETASGLQSRQFRELEFLLGHKREEVLEDGVFDRDDTRILKARLRQPSVPDHFLRFLRQRGGSVSPAAAGQKAVLATGPDEALQEVILRLYRSQPEVALLFEVMTDFDEGLQEWRYRHVKMVERTIGNKPGTGGSRGVAFLKKTLFRPLFPDLWAVRHRF
ncbi:MAG: tryptophan 2,3-dioxygenase [Acidobacteriota bacterium]